MRSTGSTFRQFARDQAGGILVFWALTLGIVLGVIALSFDLGRIGITRTELQSFADSVALASAGELDGASDAITRATNAAANLISDSKTYGSGDHELAGTADYTLTFLSSLPASDTDPLAAATTDPAEAVYVHVAVVPSQVELTFSAAFTALTGVGGPDNTANASAVAGFTQYACDITPLMFCLPSPGFEANDHVGDMILLRSGGNGAAWGPGDFGFLDPANVAVDDEGVCAGLSGGNLDRCLIGAHGSITQCFAQRGVDIEPGQKVGIMDAVFNVRFDIYKSVMNGEKNDPDYGPAPNVIKGIVPAQSHKACIGNSEAVSPDTVGLPHDTCLDAGTCGRFGDGNWAAGRANYVAVNYGGIDPHPTATTRYEYYLAEIDAAGGPAATDHILTGLAETGRPTCSPNQVPDPARRVVIAAGIDCINNPISGAASGVPVKEFVELFLTEPVSQDGSSPPKLDIWVEVIGSASVAGGGGSGSLFHDVVQLYR